MNNAKTGFSILYGFVAYMSSQIITLITIFILGMFNENIMNLFLTTEIVNVEVIKQIIYSTIIIYTLLIIIGYYINAKLFQKGVNID